VGPFPRTLLDGAPSPIVLTFPGEQPPSVGPGHLEEPEEQSGRNVHALFVSVPSLGRDIESLGQVQPTGFAIKFHANLPQSVRKLRLPVHWLLPLVRSPNGIDRIGDLKEIRRNPKRDSA
jgi:hypothetical protein